jgi:hypothetical protein
MDVRPQVDLHIEELVLHGFPHPNRHMIAAIVEEELVRLFRDAGLPLSFTENAEVARLDGGAFEITPTMGINAIGTQVARAVYGGFSDGGASTNTR